MRNWIELMGPSALAFALAFASSSTLVASTKEPPQQDEKTDVRGDVPLLDVVLTLTKREYRLLEPIAVELTVRNVDAHDRKLIILEHLYNNKRIKVMRNVGFGKFEPVPPTQYFSQGVHVPVGESGGSGGQIHPGRPQRDTLIANLVNDMTMPGEYRLVAEVDFGHYDKDNKWVALVTRSEPVEVRVTGGVVVPRNK